MSFDYNPLNHIEVVIQDEGCIVHCHSCGGSRPKGAVLPFTTTALELFDIMRQHVVISHERSEKDFEGWSDY